ncbi:MAG: TetR/AcrR family transcriptional regulator [Eubacteriales bacterium]|nr:TetR/AcrR family transcriptional regulator [Eubacteriales bacterium]
MEIHKRSVEATKQRILDSARVLFAEHGINGVSIRKIAKHAETSHSLIIRYFGSNADLATEVLKIEVEKFSSIAKPTAGKKNSEILGSIREVLLHYLTDPDARITMKMIVRAEIDGMNPELLLSKCSERPTSKLAEYMRINQIGTQLPDPDLISVVIMGAMFSLNVLSTWLFSAIGLTSDEKRYEEVVDILVDIIARSAGISGDIVSQIK